MKKLLIIAAITGGLSTQSANAATSFEVDEYNRVTLLSASAVQGKDYDRAFPLLDEAAKLGNKISQFTIALLYMEGLGVEQDYGQAYLWLNVAAEHNENRWREVRDQLHNSLSAEQIAALKPLVAEYIEKYGEEAQEVSCYKRAATGSNRKQLQCSKYKTPGR